ncbi:MAG: hypothetical protein II629_01405, partial [Ruminococcus sp.]|nr:hypothetical protein [Ruminococcus sp.]
TKTPSDTAAVFGGYCYVAAVSALRIRKTAKRKTALQATARRLFWCGLAMLAFFWLIRAQVAHSYAIFRDFSGIVRGSSPISIIERKISALNSMKHNHNFPRQRKQREPKKAVSACS